MNNCTCGCTGEAVTTTKPTMGDILLEAHEIINGGRQGLYGIPENNFQRIADYWERYLKHTKQAYLVMYPEDVAMMMVLMKIARLESGTFTKDSCTDAAGYLAWYAELAKLCKSTE